MKAKYYRISKTLGLDDAISYLRRLTGASLTAEDVIQIIEEQPLDCYVVLRDIYNVKGDGDLVFPFGPQKLVRLRPKEHLYCLCREFDEVLRYPTVSLVLNPNLMTEGGFKPRTVHLLGKIRGEEEDAEAWMVSGDELRQDEEVRFLTSDIEALAAKINAEPDYQTLQVENQRQQQEIEALKAEVERLQAENTQLKAGASVSGEINPREKETLYKMIAAMAIDGYGHNLEAKTNSTVQDIVNASTRVGIPTPERTIRKHLSAALEVLPAKPIKP